MQRMPLCRTLDASSEQESKLQPPPDTGFNLKELLIVSVLKLSKSRGLAVLLSDDNRDLKLKLNLNFKSSKLVKWSAGQDINMLLSCQVNVYE